MASVKAFIRTSKSNIQKAHVRFRLTDGRNVQLFHKSEIEVETALWDEKKEKYKAKCVIPLPQRTKFDKSIADRKELLMTVYQNAEKENLTSKDFEELIKRALNPEKYQPKKEDFFQSFDTFLEKRKLSEVRKKNFRVIKRALQRYELFYAEYENKPFKLALDTVTSDTLSDFESFLRNEHTLCEEYPEIYKAFPEKRTPQPRGQNTINDAFTRLRTFFLWAIDTERTTNNPFKNYTIEECVYGTPYYITIEERNQIFNKDLSHRPQLAIQRDIFIFQCLIGCRVGDLYKMTPDNIINGAIEYIPRKTKEGRPHTVRVPLNQTAKELIEKYKNTDKHNRLFPFISEQKYNKAIKDIFAEAEITRMVTVLNPTTGEEEKKPINEVASSHLARRTFVGNLYKKVKDPNLVSSLSGHKEGSKAFNRYREIDDEIKKELVSLLD